MLVGSDSNAHPPSSSPTTHAHRPDRLQSRKPLHRRPEPTVVLCTANAKLKEKKVATYQQFQLLGRVPLRGGRRRVGGCFALSGGVHCAKASRPSLQLLGILCKYARQVRTINKLSDNPMRRCAPLLYATAHACAGLAGCPRDFFGRSRVT